MRELSRSAPSSVLNTRDFVLLKIRYQFANVLRLDRRNDRRVSQISLALFSFTRQQVALETLAALDFAAAGHPEPFHRSSIAFDLGHLNLLFFD
jgi:hypothetical protein